MLGALSAENLSLNGMFLGAAQITLLKKVWFPNGTWINIGNQILTSPTTVCNNLQVGNLYSNLTARGIWYFSFVLKSALMTDTPSPVGSAAGLFLLHISSQIDKNFIITQKQVAHAN